MAVIDGGRATKRAKRSNGFSPDLYDFFSFPAPATGGNSPLPPFRNGVRSFLSTHARVTFPPSTLFSSLMTWQILLRVRDSSDGSDLSSRFVCLDVVEEDVTRSSRPVYCDHCRVVGWSGNPVCRKRYHFIIRSGDSTSLENWVNSQLDDHTHLLHGVIHSNGYAHLLSLNGIEGGSGFLHGRDIMDFWDRLCSGLAVRKASVMDVSRKYGMEYRLLHAVTRGQSWYGEWGHEFMSGSYGLTQDAYQSAVATLSAMPLSQFLFQGRKKTRLHSTIFFYQSLSGSELVTLRDLFSFLLHLVHKIRTEKSMEPASAPSYELCSWTRSDVERVQEAMIKVLKAARGHQTSWVRRQALKGSICRVASLDLLDYCLKHLGGALTDKGSQIVQSRFNYGPHDFEFRLVPVNSTGCLSNQEQNYPSEEHVKHDLRYLYHALLESDANPCAISLWCFIELSDESKEYQSPPPELLILPMNANVSDLKTEAGKAFQEVYAMFKRFEAEKLLGYGNLEDSITLKLLIGTNGAVHIKGRCTSKHGLIRYRTERGVDNWRVDCLCGTKDDDGEKMLSCDVCSVWYHTRCAGIEISDAFPAKFHCLRCIQLYSKKKSKKAGFVCRNSGSNLSVTLKSRLRCIPDLAFV